MPDRFYMIVVDMEQGQPRALAFIMNKDTKSPAKLEQFLASVDTVEDVAGFNFLSGLPDGIEDPLEAKVATGLWPTSGPTPIPSPEMGLVDINTAASEDLELLPEIGPVLAQRIVLGRPYRTVDDLLKVSGIGAPTLERLRPLITVK